MAALCSEANAVVRRADTMRDVVAWLQSADAEALAELQAFEAAIDDLCGQLCVLYAEVQALTHDVERLAAVVERHHVLMNGDVVRAATSHAASLWHIAQTCAEIRRGIQSWGLGGLQREYADGEGEADAKPVWKKPS